MSKDTPSALQKLIAEDAVGQLRRREGLMATLGSEDGVVKLDWVEGVERLLADGARLEEVEAEAREIWVRGIRHIIWTGMGGSILTVQVLRELGFCDGQDGNHIAIYPLDSTDPAALNEIVRTIARTKQLVLSHPKAPLNPEFLRTLLGNVMMIGVSMGMTSEEPITHLTWFTELLEQAQLQPAEHLLVMTLPGSYLNQFAREHSVPSRPLQLDGGTGTGGRMSAPTTRVFLLPAALYLLRQSPQPGQLRHILQQAWQQYDLAQATERPAGHTFVRLAAALSDASVDGACRMLLRTPAGWHALVPWIEQLMEESLGKEGKGVVVFDDQQLNPQAPGYRRSDILHVHSTTDGVVEENVARFFALHQPYLVSETPQDRLAAVATSFLGWQLSMALYGYLHHITFAGQPAVENYKARARVLRTGSDPLQAVQDWEKSVHSDLFTLLAPQAIEPQSTPAHAFARALQQAVTATDERLRPGYLDVTFNGKPSTHILPTLFTFSHVIGNHILGVPVKLRLAPAAYHSTEQSEMDGPPYLISLRLLARKHEESILGTYTDTFLHAQAVSTWLAMIEQGRACFLLVFDDTTEAAVEPLHRFCADIKRYLEGHHD